MQPLVCLHHELFIAVTEVVQCQQPRTGTVVATQEPAPQRRGQPVSRAGESHGIQHDVRPPRPATAMPRAY